MEQPVNGSIFLKKKLLISKMYMYTFGLAIVGIIKFKHYVEKVDSTYIMYIQLISDILLDWHLSLAKCIRY